MRIPRASFERMQKLVAVFVLLVNVSGCAENYTHDENSAAKQALQFAEVAFVRHDFQHGWELLADKARAYVPLEKFKETVTGMHPNGYPMRVMVIGTEEIKGEKIVNVLLRGEGKDGSSFNYRFSVAGTAQTGYRVATFSTGGMGAF